MLYYSIIPGEVIFNEEDEEVVGTKETDLIEVEVNGITMLVKQTEVDAGEIVKVISSNPKDYLNLNYQPGNVVQFTPEFSM
ncbi:MULTISPECIES: YlzJ-like family protein [unclassified Candidatus Frackibacter]|uniref:YlzJ-like family protein n=1 Tax=unclassified Candidatus Frackibacter TaxID=2648818 RepID=UPI000887E459|nr:MULTISPECIES: YlzJ-like family protein [unclassified Candidatus Frackibacter]SDB98068.1 YlzJ-like protein [Candidatus Frackibacter sp. WG11]SEM29775.1 YlzJ-like protein [Candidatus Frackibacter sp. WG12]SFL34696.1 YlzJ-like protein [Candidatus Frackibacter sp. WG13]